MRRTTFALFAPFTLAFALSGCHHAAGHFGDGTSDGGTDDIGTQQDFDTLHSGDAGGLTPKSITITPNPATIDVTSVDGVVTATPFPFTAKADTGVVEPASWTIDRGELGALVAATGVFTPNGKNAGKATVTATFGALQATATLTVNVHAKNTGANASSGTGPQAPDPAPSGGYNGVGGSSLGAAPPAASVTLLDGNTGSDPAFTMLYPYDATVWPRGQLAPLLQWSVPSGFHPNAISVHLSQAGYDFTGYYASSDGKDIVNAPIDAAAWKLATNDNTGDALIVEVKVTDGTKVLGPLQESWSIAGSQLRGTVYYNTYNSQLNPGGDADGNGAVLKINPGGFAPDLAIASLKGTCHVCHEVSQDGSQLFVATSINSNIGSVYDLTSSTASPVNYSNGTFTYGGIYPDGSMAFLSSEEDYHAWDDVSKLYSRTPVADLAGGGLSGIIGRAVTPAFSPDGRTTAFNFWTGTGAGTVTAGNGQSIAAMDFDCGAPSGSTTCASTGPYAFSGLREVYRDPSSSHYVGWPSFTPDSKAVVFQRTTSACTDGGSVLNTRNGAQAEMWIADTTATPAYTPMPLCAANGLGADCKTSYLPTSSTHASDASLNFEPNITPIAAGGYYWVVFTSRRLYGNVAAGSPYYPVQGDGAPVTPPTKKLWVAAIDITPTPGKDPSHPAFYLPGQEIMSGNQRGYWVKEACEPAGDTCETGDECCTGYCNDDGSGNLTCGAKPTGCIPEFGKCTTSTDCCGTGQLACIGGLCSESAPPIL